MNIRLMAGILSALLALFGLGGCKKQNTDHLTDGSDVVDIPELPEPLDGPDMYFDSKLQFINSTDPWVDPNSNQTILFTNETLLLKDGDRTVWEGAWEIAMIDGYIYGAQSANGEPIGEYAYFTVNEVSLPENYSPSRSYLAAYRTDRTLDEAYILFECEQ